ncbi:hypothetical protein CDL15_Pgr014201 [Punica granatum]|uniref:Uncharacterized protein n=1 Tax=Punica granatum TaxID=22663 RepID=A0A218XCP7_PUNGR|nr:hypothetical protein CDL15_Pgr014201 [Punica granatum]
MSTNSLDRPGLCKNPKKAKEPVDLFGSDLERSSVSLPELLGISAKINVGIDPKGIDHCAKFKVGIDPKGIDSSAEFKVGIDPSAEIKVGIDLKGIDPSAEIKVGIDLKGIDPSAEIKVGIDPSAELKSGLTPMQKLKSGLTRRGLTPVQKLKLHGIHCRMKMLAESQLRCLGSHALTCKKFVESQRLVLRDSSSKTERLRISWDWESESIVVHAVYSTCDPDITSKSLQMGPVLEGLDARPPGAPVIPNCLDGMLGLPTVLEEESFALDD